MRNTTFDKPIIILIIAFSIATIILAALWKNSSFLPTPRPPRPGSDTAGVARAESAVDMLTPTKLVPATLPYPVRRMRVTAYCPCKKCCGRWAGGLTSSQQPISANGGKFVAAPKSIPFFTLVEIPGYAGGDPVPILDRGGAIQGDRLDCFFPTHAEALEWGVRYLGVTIHERKD